MALSRYAIVDAYTLEELRRKYERSDTSGKIFLLQELDKRDGTVPFEIAVLAVEDKRVEVREWIARYGGLLDYREVRFANEELIHEFPERNLEDRLKNDPDPFVRACLRENRSVFNFGHWDEFFNEATHLERLALARNPVVDESLIKKIFDYEDKSLGISREERKELALAFLTNSEAIEIFKDDVWSPLEEWPNLNTLWELVSKWPKETKLQAAVCRYLPANDETKARIYSSCDEPVWRQEILRNCSANDTKTIKVALQDGDKDCRSMAESLNLKLRP